MSYYDVKFDELSENSSWKIAFGLISSKSDVLDVGCSKGDFGKALIRDKDCTVDGIEPATDDYEVARNILHKISNKPAETALESDFKDSTYDYISFMDVIEHLYDPVDVLLKSSKHLKPDGRIVFSIPNMAHVSVRLMLLQGDFDYGKTGLLDRTHLHFYTRREIYRVFTEAGYDIDELKFSEAAYPRELIEDSLRRLGLEPTEGALKLLSGESASVFQYVGTAKASGDGPHEAKRADYSPDAQGEITRMYEKKLAVLQKQLKDKKTEIASLKKKTKEP